jgi:hypothetical protein
MIKSPRCIFPQKTIWNNINDITARERHFVEHSTKYRQGAKSLPTSADSIFSAHSSKVCKKPTEEFAEKYRMDDRDYIREFEELCLEIINDVSENTVFFNLPKCASAQSHLFSCLSLMELLDDGTAITDDNLVHWMDASEELHTIDISSEFTNLNEKFGFHKSIFVDFSNNYKKLWQDLFGKVANYSIDISAQVENFEENFYELFLKRAGKDCPFVEIIETGAVTTREETGDDAGTGNSECSTAVAAAAATAATAPPIEKPVAKRRNRTLRRRRVLTPIYRRKGFNRTYKDVREK